MKKTVSFLLTVASLLTLTVVSFTGCGLMKEITVDEAKSNLEDAGYTVTVMSGEEYVESDKNEYMLMEVDLLDYLYAVKGSDEIHMYFFVSIDAATHNYEFMSAPKNLLGGQSNTVVYFATKQARKDAKV